MITSDDIGLAIIILTLVISFWATLILIELNTLKVKK